MIPLQARLAKALCQRSDTASAIMLNEKVVVRDTGDIFLQNYRNFINGVLLQLFWLWVVTAIWIFNMGSSRVSPEAYRG